MNSVEYQAYKNIYSKQLKDENIQLNKIYTNMVTINSQLHQY